MKNIKTLLVLILLVTLTNCAVQKVSTDEVLLRYTPQQGDVYDLVSNVNIALNTAQPVNLNMELFSTVSFDEVTKGESFTSTNKITRVVSIASSSIFHRSYDSDNPLLENDVEKQMHEQFSRILNLDFTSKQDNKGVKLETIQYDSIFGTDEKIKSQFKEMEQSISNTSLVYPTEKLKVGSSWMAEIESQSSIYPVIQKITYTVTKITPTEVYLSQKGIIIYETDKVEGGGEIEGNSIIDRSSGIVKSAKQSQVMKMKIGDYHASSANNFEVINTKRN